MILPPGVHRFGPANASLTVKTGRTGAASKAGHDLVLEVTAWEATLEIDEANAPTRLALEADPTSLRVLEGTGGMQELGDDDKASIVTSIDEDVLERKGIVFRSRELRSGAGEELGVQGELELAGRRRPISFALAVAQDGAITGSATVTQSDWGVKPYSILFGALKVADEVEVVIAARLPAA